MAISAAAAVASTGYSIYAGQKSASMQEKAMQQQETAQKQQLEVATKQQKSAEENMNRANAKTADAGAILSAAQQASSGGGAGTMLTGPQGVDPNSLALGKNTLLGG